MRRASAVAVLVFVALIGIVGQPTLASAAPGKCDVPLVDPLCEAGKTVAGKAGDIVTAPVRYAANGAVEAITSWVADAAQWTLQRVIVFIDHSTTPALGSDWFEERYRFMIGLAALVVLPMLLIATLRAVITQDLSQLLRSFCVYLPVAILGAFAAIHLTQALLAITDSLSAAVADNIAGDASSIFDSVGGTLSGTGGAGPVVPSFALFFGALLLIVGAFFVWLELLVRSAAVTVAVFFLPLIFAGLVWPSAMRWTKRLIEILAALILSKFVIVAVISLATAALADPGEGGFGTVMGASSLMLMAAFSPFALLKLVPMVEGAAIDHLQGKSRAPVDSIRPEGGVNQIVSVMKARTRRGGSGPGLAVAGAGASGASAGIAGAASAGAVTTARAAGAATKAPGEKLEQQTQGSTPPENVAARSEPRASGGRATPPSGRGRNRDKGQR